MLLKGIFLGYWLCYRWRNEPGKLLKLSVKPNRILHGEYSPLNGFTQRRNMLVRHCKPNDHTLNRLSNGAGIGLIKIGRACKNAEAQQLCASGEIVNFIKNG